ncbi:ABC transporter substrate-binding protein [Oceanirhabdus sp. W0125-5]|uniref:ABC transporter substrate-binding protein n=1 Tax=Oceanirhabdus sp. W0125-5 TaxID=2999116 RepID=UPI0022F2CB29|nr:sugar ABC transporter substrate-binding protein [Oceanirhabdus sp. W0125-5]WBW96252.1 sugar ABC transporter substrate-binding protein [Oceanirhabdus sp. W0125-5]
MKKVKKIILVGLALALSVGTLVGCTNSKNNKKNEVAKESSVKQTEHVTLKFFVPGYTDPTFGKAYDATLKAFEKAHPEIKIDLMGTGWGQYQKMMSMIQAGDAPDIMITGSRNLNQLSELGAIEQLDQYVTDERKAEYIESVLDTGKVNGKQFGLPTGFSSRALYYRKDLIKEAPKTWDELVEISKKIEEENPGMKGFAIPGAPESSTIAQLFNFFYQNGAKAFDETGKPVINSPEAVEAFQFYTDLYKKHNVVPNPVEITRSNFADLFKSGQIAMFVSGPWEKNRMQLEPDNDKTPYGVALLPKGKQYGETLVTDSITISSQCENKEAAAMFIEFFTACEYQNKFDGTVGFFPIFKAEAEEERYNNDFLKPFVEIIQYGQPEPNPLVWDEFEEIVVKAIQKTMLGEATAEEALNEAQKLLEESMKK